MRHIMGLHIILGLDGRQVYEKTRKTTTTLRSLMTKGSAARREMKRMVEHTKVRAAPFVFFSPPNSKLVTMIRHVRNKTKQKGAHCLQRLSDNCILYLHTVHSSRKTTFFVVFACTHSKE
jgi:hypothetical protein